MLTHTLLITTFLYSKAFAFTFAESPLGFRGNATIQLWGSSGVSAMMAQVVTDQQVIFLDRIENNPLKDPDGNPYWASEFTVANKAVRGLKLASNSFCASGAFLADGTFVSLGGDIQSYYNAMSGLQSVRRLTPCSDMTCEFTEEETLMRKRWYPGTVKVADGTILVAGGLDNTRVPVYQNNMEWFPPRPNVGVWASQFLKDAYEYNLFPHMYLLPSGRIFMAANQLAMLYDWQNNKETRLPGLAMKTNYPFGAASSLLPLRSSSSYKPTVVFCGGTQIEKGQTLTIDLPAFDKCARMDLTADGITQGWDYEDAPVAVIMANFVISPTGKLILITGASNGFAGYFSKLQSGTGMSSAKNPVLEPFLYDPDAPAGQRWSQLGVKLQIPRMYHSVATMTPRGDILISGSNPNPGFKTGIPFPTITQNELLSPWYMTQLRPTMSGVPLRLSYGQTFRITIAVPLPLKTALSTIEVSLHDFGFITHGMQYQQRMVVLDFERKGTYLDIVSPPFSALFPPGPAWLFVSIGGVPTLGRKLLIG